jgi:hypothetical protein
MGNIDVTIVSSSIGNTLTSDDSLSYRVDNNQLVLAKTSANTPTLSSVTLGVTISPFRIDASNGAKVRVLNWQPLADASLSAASASYIMIDNILSSNYLYIAASNWGRVNILAGRINRLGVRSVLFGTVELGPNVVTVNAPTVTADYDVVVQNFKNYGKIVNR